MKAPVPKNELERLDVLYQYEILDTPSEVVFDELTRLASSICDTPIALISLIDRDRQWLKSKLGLDISQTSRDTAFCAHTILQSELLIVPDTLQDSRFAGAPAVVDQPQIRFYAGAPLLTPDGFALGALCTLDYHPRTLSPKQLAALQTLAHQVMVVLELRRITIAYQEAVTQYEQSEADQQVQLLQTLTLMISEAPNFDAALQGLLQTVCQTRGWDYGEVWFPDAKGEVLQCSPVWYANPQDSDRAQSIAQFRTLSATLTFSPEVGLAGRVWATGRPEWWIDQHHPYPTSPRQSMVQQWGIKVGLGIPIVADNQVLTILVFFKFKASAEDQRLIASLSSVATQLGAMLQRKQVDQALVRREQEFRALAENSPDVICRVDRDLRHCYVNPAIERLGRSRDDYLGKTPAELGNAESLHLFWTAVRQAFATCKEQAIEVEIPVPEGHLEFYYSRIVPEFAPDGSVESVLIVSRDITQLKQAEQALFQEKELAQVTLQSIGDAVVTTDALGCIQYFNPVATALTGWTYEEVKGMPLADVFKIVSEVTRELVRNPIEQALQAGEITGLANHSILIAKDGKEIAIEDSAAPIRDRHGRIIGAVMVFQDVSHARHLTHQLSWQASHDALTELVNRREFEILLEQALGDAKAQNQHHVLCYLDLDRFKIVNDTCGHMAGDELLRQITVVLQTHIRKTDTLARLGGDEFGLLLAQCPLEAAQRIAHSLREAVQEFRFSWENKVFTIGVSIGLVAINRESENVVNILSLADAACYAAKNNGRNRIHIYQANDLDFAKHQGEIQWVTRITSALAEDRFELYAQPIIPIDLAQPQGEHYEVLLRLRDENGDLISPTAFLPAAERYNLMHLIDRWVISKLFMTQADRYKAQWQQCDYQQQCQTDYLYTVNLSGASINDDQFIDFLHQQFARYQVPAQLLCFEITETVAIANLTKAAQFIRELKDLGCRFALDDFGSGMSSFAYLKHLPVDFLKIDGGFIRQIVDNPVDLAVVEAINQVGKAMGIQTIAEFVENNAILEKLRNLGVDYAQGYGISKPYPLEDSVSKQSMSGQLPP
jgi:diguanylate cyclase (GGDEF)-like protein/PAS domain S-box-containing protein